jgi:hypothetical protein
MSKGYLGYLPELSYLKGNTSAGLPNPQAFPVICVNLHFESVVLMLFEA